MRNAKLKNYLHLHLIVFIWGFTAVLGKLISIDALPLVWHRMFWASLLIALFMIIKGYSFRRALESAPKLILAGIAIGLHWVTFFWAIKVSNVSVTLATMSTGAFFTALLEPIWYGRKFSWVELIFGLIVILGLYLMLDVDTSYLKGISLALVSTFLGAVFTLINGQLVQKHRPTAITFFELSIGTLVLTAIMGFTGYLDTSLLAISISDVVFLSILITVCTVYAFIASVHVMRHISPYTVVLTVNMEPVYGILLALIVFGESEAMHPQFYFGALIIILTVLANGVIKYRSSKRLQ